MDIGYVDFFFHMVVVFVVFVENILTPFERIGAAPTVPILLFMY